MGVIRSGGMRRGARERETVGAKGAKGATDLTECVEGWSGCNAERDGAVGGAGVRPVSVCVWGGHSEGAREPRVRACERGVEGVAGRDLVSPHPSRCFSTSPVASHPPPLVMLLASLSSTARPVEAEPRPVISSYSYPYPWRPVSYV
jgi:hypothetical protein